MDAVSSWLLNGLIFLGAAVLAVPLARLLGLGSVIGYLAAGIAIGPWGLRLVTDATAILHIAEFGVVLMLFLVGLELEPRRLWALRRPIFGWGTVQLLGSTALVAGVALAAGLDWRLALVSGLALAQSSTAIALSTLAERNLMPTAGGRSILSVSLFQDIGGIAILTLLPLLAVQQAHGAGGWMAAAQAVGMVLAIVFGGRLLLRPALRWIARSDTPEIFTAASLLLVVATAALMQAVGLSMALGAFLAGVLLAGSEYRRQLETDLEPFKGLLLGLFFIAVGMSIDFAVVRAQPFSMAAVVLGFLLVKALLLLAMARWMGIPLAERPVFVVMLAQGGEFGFVVLQAAGGAALLPPAAASFLLAAIAISMLLTPLVMVLVDRVIVPRLAAGRSGPTPPEIAEEQAAPILILGFGRYGQIVARLINAEGLAATVLDHDAGQVASVRKFGWPAHYGDATRLDLLRVAGAGRARVVVVAIDDVGQSLAAVDLLREHFPNATIVARARNTTHWAGLHARGVQHIERETLDSALMSGRSVLELMGWEPHTARNQALRFRRHNLELLHELAAHQGDERSLIALAKQGRAQLEQLWAREREQRRAREVQRGEGFAASARDGLGDGPD
ncbi:MAG: glutathione-regulated potassium-efflux system protein KefC [Ideonella sp. WA131b]|jgi:glutathione-regulated potassium-efflux system ancillary protein KefC|nr:glutathione-regulated potassium-efflux system protein KefC [Ideonella sp. WA131b]